ncbi:serine/threonine protein kinase [Arthrobacter sp. LS16]|uniref:serine/threonine protein kinase n=1 Tax=Arthrobacter sp. 'calajunan' TaxID=1690248 RepID=UPI003C71C813
MQSVTKPNIVVTMKKLMVFEIDGDTYTVTDSQLGQGGAGTVRAVRSSADGRVYALKQIRKDARSERNERFRQEIDFGRHSNNDHVVKIHAYSEDDTHFYYTMDLYPKNLRHIVEEETDYWVILDYLSQLCDGLSYVHDQGVVHRDIKPENILVDSDNQRLVLADFGIAHFKDSSLTVQGDLLANRNYQAPEQMIKNNANNVGNPADIFALGLIFTEIFTKQNARGVRHRRVGDIYPFLSNLDLLVERMMLQDATQRITIQAVRDSLNLIRKQIDARLEEIKEDLRPSDESIIGNIPLTDLLEQAGADVMSAKYIFERTTSEELARYNPNYHCQVSYSVSAELYNGCVHSILYSMCKAKFEYEANGAWSESDMDLVLSPLKTRLVDEFESIQSQYPLEQDSLWAALPRKAAHYFRFCKDYHCQELIEQARRQLTVSDGPYNGSLYSNLMNAPILWIVQNVRRHLTADIFNITSQTLHEIEFERQVRINWEGTDWDSPKRIDVGRDIFDPAADAQNLVVLEKLREKWNTSFVENNDDTYSIHFNSYGDYEQFSKEALAMAVQDYVFEGDVHDLLRPDEIFDDLVALTWGATFDIPNTLAKILGLRDI